MIKSLVISSVILNSGILLGRFSGFFRESFVASTYGAGIDADVVVLMLTVPDMLVNILMGGALGSVLIPEFVKSNCYARRLLYQSTMCFGFIFIAITALLYINMETLIGLLAPGFNEYQLMKSVETIKWVIWLVPLTVMAGVTTAYLQAKEKFAVPAMGTLIVNMSIIIGLVVAGKYNGNLFTLSVFVLIGGLLRLFSQVIQVKKVKFSPFQSFKPFYITSEIMKRYLQAVMSGSVLLLFPVVSRAYGSYLEEGSVSLLNYSTKLIEFPMAIMVTFLSVILFPKLSGSFIDNKKLHTKIVKYGVQVTLLLSLLAGFALSNISDAYSSLVYGYGKITPENLSGISSLTSLGMMILPLMGVSSYLTAVFNSRKNTKTPLLTNFIGFSFYIFILEFEIFGSSLSGIILSMIVGYLLIALLLFLTLRVEGVRWLEVLFEPTFILGIIFAILTIYFLSKAILGLGLSAFFTMSLSAISSLIVLVFVVLLNNEVRLYFKTKMQNL